MKRKRRVALISDLHANGLAESKKDVQQPLDGDAPLEGLVVLKGYKCSEPSCSRVSINRGEIEKHCRTAHSWRSGPRGGRERSDRMNSRSVNPTKRWRYRPSGQRRNISTTSS